ncbi:SAM-dependent methyltransferase, partial [Micromonospora sp. DH15]|nr:SAM-dependent methyltransferase [Micromonospora sp. DH15]
VGVGSGPGRGDRQADFAADAVAAGLRLEHRFATWDLRPWRDDADFAVTVLRRPA